MKISNDIRIFIVEDDQAQSEVLYDKLLEYNSDYTILQFKSGEELLAHFNNAYTKHKYNYLILDFYLQSNEDEESLGGYEIIKILNEKHPKIKIIVFSAYDGDDDANFKQLTEEPNVMEFVKKSNFAYSSIQNLIRFDYAKSSLTRKKKRLHWTLVIFFTLLSLSFLHFLFNYLSV